MKFLHYGMSGAVAVLLLSAAGCYNYTKPASATLGNSYTDRTRDAADDLFKGMSELTLRDAQRIAIKNNPSYIAAFHAVEAARMRYYQAWGAYSPTLSVSFNMANSDSWITSNHQAGWNAAWGKHNVRSGNFATTTSLQANMLLFDGFARFFRLRAAQSEQKYYKHMEEDALRTMMLAVSYAYNSVLLAVEQRRIAAADRKFQLESLQNTRHKFEAGAAPLSDVLNFEILANNADVNLIEADYAYETAVYALAVLMGYPDGTLPGGLKFAGDFKAHQAQLPAVEVYLNAALSNRPDLKAYREQLNISRYQVYQAAGAFAPTVEGYAAMSPRTVAYQHMDSGSERSYYQANVGIEYGINVNWVVFNGAIRYNKLREAQAAMAVADYSVAAQWFKVVDEVRNAYANYNQNVRKTALLLKIRNLSAKQRDLVNDEYRAGHAELTRLNEAQRDLVTAESNLASSFINIQNAKAQLDSVVGGNTENYYMQAKPDSKAYPGLGNVNIETVAPKNQPAAAAAAEQRVESKAAAPNTVVPAPAPRTKGNAAAPAIPASATAAPAAK